MGDVGSNSEGSYSDEHLNEEVTPEAVELQKKYLHLRKVVRDESEVVLTLSHPSEFLTDVEHSKYGKHFSDADIRSLHCCFQMADHDGDGQLNELELKYWMEKHKRPISHRDARHILQELDVDDDGGLSFVEFLDFCVRIGFKEKHTRTRESIFDCLEEDSVSIPDLYKRRSAKNESHLHLNVDLQSNLQFFQHKILNENAEDEATNTASSDSKYADILQEIKSVPSDAFNLQELCRHIQHPQGEVKSFSKCSELEQEDHQRSGTKNRTINEEEEEEGDLQHPNSSSTVILPHDSKDFRAFEEHPSEVMENEEHETSRFLQLTNST